MKPTDEQMRIRGSAARKLVIQAGAGAAKTTTLCLYAAARPHDKGLYLAFNKAIQLEAAEKRPTIVVCRTPHSMAWRVAAELFGARAKDCVGNTYPSSVARAFGCSALAASAALRVIQAWCGSLEDEIQVDHLPEELAERLADPTAVVGLARDVWAQMQTGRNRDVRLPHDGYLKLFQMSQPKLRGYDFIMVDEAQDLNPCTFDIVRKQLAVLVLVGDEAQGIYGFRGSVNALALLDADERLSLTRSFRFGKGIADLANALLGNWREGFNQPLIGAGEPQRTRFAVDTNKPFAVVARTNAMIFDDAVSFLSLNRQYHFVGGADGYRFEKILDAYYLWSGDSGMARDPYLRTFSSFEDLEQVGEESEDHEIKHLVRVVQEYKHRIPGLIDEIKSRSAEKLDKKEWAHFAGIFFATGHKCKGLEFDQVWVADDFMAFFEDGVELDIEEVEPEEVHLLYVAMTRARSAIRISDNFREWLEYRGLVPECHQLTATPSTR